MSLSLVERLNNIAKQQQQLLKPVSRSTILSQDYLNNGTSGWNELLSDLQTIDDDSERSQWLRTFFVELLQTLFSKSTDPSVPLLPIDNVATFINDLTKIPSTHTHLSMTSIVGKSFIAAVSCVPEVKSDDAKLIELATKSSRIHSEIFKFSWLSSKLSTKPQTQLLRHLLKKSKYEISKFNLLPENSVGFSELVVLYLTAYNDENRMNKIDWYIQEITYVCGKYSLDSERCLDIFLSISAINIIENYKFFIAYLRKIKLIEHDKFDVNLHQIVCFNLDKRDNDSLPLYVDMCAIMVKYKFLDGQMLFNNIQPDLESLKKQISDKQDELEKESMKGIDNPLAMAAALTSEEDNDYHNNKFNKGDTGNIDTNLNDLPTAPRKAEKAPANEPTDPRKVILLKSLLSHGCVEDAFLILNHLPKLTVLDDEISKLVARIFEYMLIELYSSYVYKSSTTFKAPQKTYSVNDDMLSQKPRLILEQLSDNAHRAHLLNSKSIFYFQEWSDDISQISSIDELFEKSHEFFSLIGFDFTKDTSVLFQLCRIAISDLKKESANSDKSEKLENWINYFRKFILPVIPLLGVHPTAINQVFSLMRLFPFEKRYFMYNEMITKLSQDSLPLRIASNIAERDIRNVLKALSIDTISKEARKLANLVSSNPLATLIPIVKQIENYDKVSELVVHSTRYYNDFAYDVLQYVLLLRLTQNRSALQDDGINESMWAQRLSIFIAELSAECPEMDLSNIIIFVIKKLHQGNPIATSILKQLLSRVAGIRDLNEVNNNSILMLNSGEPLKREARKLIYDTRDSKRLRATAVFSLFEKQKSISEIIILLYNQCLQTNTMNKHYKILSTTSDNLNTLLWSFTELIKFCLNDEKFISEILSFETLCVQYDISVPWVFHIWRDIYDKNSVKDPRQDSTIESLIENIQFPHVNFNNIQRSLFVKFWRYALYDIHLDQSLYTAESDKLSIALSKNDLDSRKRKVLLKAKDELTKSLETHQLAFNVTKDHLLPFYNGWVKDTDKDQLLGFLQYCVIPRALFTPSDAIYASHFIFYGFPTDFILQLLKVFMKSNILNTLLFSATISEAGNLGIFIETLVSAFEKKRISGELSDEKRRQLYEIHESIVEQLIDLLQEKNYMSIRNGIEFMKHVSNVYPVIDNQVKILIAALENNLVNEEREDIKLPTNALIGHLKARLRKESIPLWEFCELTEREKTIKEDKEAEQKEIDGYLQVLDNEKKEADIRKKLEMNKQKREAETGIGGRTFNYKESHSSEKPIDIYDDFNNQADEEEWPLAKVFRTIGDTVYYLNMNNIKEAARCIKDENLSKQILDASTADIPVESLRKTVFDLSKQFFSSLIRHANNSDFQVGLKRLNEACQSLTKKSANDISDLYGDDTVKPPTRYNNARPASDIAKQTPPLIPNKPAGESYSSSRADTRTVGRNNTRFNRNSDSNRNYDKSNDNSNKKYYPQRHSDQYTKKPQGYNRKNDVSDNSSRGIKRSLPTGPEMSSANKQVKTEGGHFKKNTRYSNKPQDEQFVQNDNRGQSNDRYGYKNQQYNKNKNNNNGPNRYANNGLKSNLPQGPRNQSSSNSRYQK